MNMDSTLWHKQLFSIAAQLSGVKRQKVPSTQNSPEIQLSVFFSFGILKHLPAINKTCKKKQRKLESSLQQTELQMLLYRVMFSILFCQRYIWKCLLTIRLYTYMFFISCYYLYFIKVNHIFSIFDFYTKPFKGINKSVLEFNIYSNSLSLSFFLCLPSRLSIHVNTIRWSQREQEYICRCVALKWAPDLYVVKYSSKEL